jgi:hypothetical protein
VSVTLKSLKSATPFAMLLSTIGKPLMSRKDLPSWFHEAGFMMFSAAVKKKSY